MSLADRRRIGGRVVAGTRLEMISEVGAGLIAHFFGRGLAAMLSNARRVVNAHAANVQLRPTLRTFVKAAQGQAQSRETRPAFPADKIVGHRRVL